MKDSKLLKNNYTGKLKKLILTAFAMLAVGCGEKNDLSESGWSNSEYGIAGSATFPPAANSWQ